MVLPGLINLDFADVRSVMGEMGKAMMGTGEGSGENRALDAAERAIANPLLDGISMQGAKGVIISIIGGDDMKLLEVDEAANHIRDLVDPNANIIWGSAFNPDLQGKIRISVVATGIEQSAEQAEIAVRPISLAAPRGPIRPAIVTPASAREPVFQPAVELEPVAAATEERPVANDLDLDDLSEDAVSTDDEVTMASDASATRVPASPGDALDLKLERVNEQETAEASRVDGQDDLLLNGNPLADEDAPVSPLVSERRDSVAPGAGGRAPVAGNTLFERMTSLSRKVKPSVAELSVDEDEDDGSAINKRRFLGRQTS
jgi:cell division protein FtsZ